MAVVNNFWLRDNKQRLGGAVIYQSNGQTLMRQLAPSVSNPRTDAQMETRVKLANLVAFYRASAGWMRGAFEAKPANQSDYNAFVSANAANNNVWLTKTQVETGNAIVAPYVVSRGSLGEIVQTTEQNAIFTNLYVGTLSIEETTSVNQLTAAILNNNNGLQEGDQLSIIQYIQNTATNGSYTITCRPYEVILSLSDSTLLSNYLPVDILTTSNGDNAALGVLTSSFTGGAAFIISRTAGGRILVSTSSVTLTPNNTVYPAMTSDSQKSTAIRSYGTNTVVFLDSNLAGAANSNVNTSVAIIALIFEDQTYVNGSALPNDWPGGEDLTLILSAPVNVADGASVDISVDGETQKVHAIYNGPALNGVSSVKLTTEDAVQYNIVNTSPNTRVEFDAGTDNILLYAQYKMQTSGLE